MMQSLFTVNGNHEQTGHAAVKAVWFTPGLDTDDPYTAYWVRQAVLRLRRELCWAWRQAQAPDPLNDALNRSRLHEQRLDFFERDETARHLSELIAEPGPAIPADCGRGTFRWLAGELGLLPAEIFTAALVLMHTWDAAAAEVIGSAQGDARRSIPTLGLAQRLWDEPGALSSMTNRTHPLFRMGILRAEASDVLDWRTPLSMPALVAQRLLAAADAPPVGFTAIHGGGAAAELPMAARLVALRACEPIAAPHVIPLRAASSLSMAAGGGVQGLLQSFSKTTGRSIYALSASRPGTEIQTAATLCWLAGADLYLQMQGSGESHGVTAAFMDIPVYVLALSDQEKLEAPGWTTLPSIDIPALDLEARLACWTRCLPEAAALPDSALENCAFRFRFDAVVIEEIARALARETQPLTGERLIAACRQRAAAAPGTLAVRVRPRFKGDELVLPPAQQRQFEELVTAMQALPEVHARWGTGRVWDEAGISALFAGPPGTGKTMAAEVLAARLGLPMFRVDLSQVVNKYIGETEKNLRRLFDSVEESDALLFFDEADSLFGQRMQVRNAHDRYANLEVSYLLQRMERFRGVAILATNRRKDLDEAFLRRLRFVLEFPLPDAPERKRIWQSGIPEEVDASSLDFDFLARQFALSGGHIRSIILHACLQSAGPGNQRTLSMNTIMRSVKRECQKLDRTLTREQCGKWGEMLEREDR
jgi:hypothetical protein